jgi:hypothetical protein
MLPRHTHLAAVPLLLLTTLLASSCGDGGTEPPPNPTKLILVVEPSAVAETMVPLATQPVVQAADANGQAAATATTVTVDVLSGNGSVRGGGSVTTDASGRATFSDLTLGSSDGVIGPVTLRFSAPGLEGTTAILDLRCSVPPLSIGQTVNRALSTGDCANGGFFYNVFEVTTSQPITAVRLSLEPTFFPKLLFRGANEPLYVGWSNPVSTDAISYQALLPPGRNRVYVSSGVARQTGDYRLTVVAASGDLSCEGLPAWAASPITIAQQLAAGDCTNGSFLEDVLLVGLPQNASITASMSSTAFQPHIKLVDALTGAVAASATTAGTASIGFTNSDVDKIFYLVFTTNSAGGSGPYTLSLNVTYPSSGTAATVPALRLPSFDAEVSTRKATGPGRIAGPFSPVWARSPH